MKKEWLIAAVLVVGLIIGVGVQSIFHQETAYFYHPSSDRIFKTKFGLSSTIKPWEPFVPFMSLHYGDSVYGEYLGKLSRMLEEIEADKKLDDKARHEKFLKWSEEMIEMFSLPFTLYNFEYAVNQNTDVSSLLPKSLSILNLEPDEIKDNVRSVDFVVIKTIHLADDDEDEFKQETEILENGLLLRWKAAYELSEVLLAYRGRRDSEP